MINPTLFFSKSLNPGIDLVIYRDAVFFTDFLGVRP